MWAWPGPNVTAVVLATSFGAGLANRLIGLGFPTITVAVLAIPIGLVPAVAVTVAPAIVTNVVARALTGGRLRALLGVAPVSPERSASWPWLG